MSTLSLSTSTPRYAVIGSPIAHSLSPLLHSYWYKRLKISAQYFPILVEPQDVTQWLKGSECQSLAGFNITAPHKGTCFQELKAQNYRSDPLAEELQSCNTFAPHHAEYQLYNTDLYGFTASLRQFQKQSGSLGPTTKILLLGAGVTARTIGKALAKDFLSDQTPLHLTVINRTASKAEALVQELQQSGLHAQSCPPSEQQALLSSQRVDFQLIINTVSAGWAGQGGEQWEASHFQNIQADCLVYDVLYRPGGTDFLKAAQAQGLPTSDGLAMLVYQAQKAFELWFNVLPPVDEGLFGWMRQVIEQRSRNKR